MTKKPTLCVKLIKSVITCRKDQKGTVLGLGLKKIGQVRKLEDSPSIRGMINKVSHLVELVGEKRK